MSFEQDLVRLLPLALLCVGFGSRVCEGGFGCGNETDIRNRPGFGFERGNEVKVSNKLRCSFVLCLSTLLCDT